MHRQGLSTIDNSTVIVPIISIAAVAGDLAFAYSFHFEPVRQAVAQVAG